MSGNDVGSGGGGWPSDVGARARRTLDYHWNVNVLGRGFLRWQRVRGELRARRRARDPRRRHPHLAPPLRSTIRLRELVSRHYLEGRHAAGHRKVAWVTSGAPVEFLTALDYHLFYPENHGALCGVRRSAVEACEAAEAAGYSRDICSYARTDIGTVLSGQTPVGSISPPDLLLCCTNICQTVLHWYRVLAEHFQVPLVLIDTPFLYGEARPHDIAYVQQQLEEAIVVAERVAGKRLRPAALQRVVERSRDAVELWAEVMARGQHRPTPITAFDEFFLMSPIVQMRGQAETVDFYRAVLAELDRRIQRGEGALRDERYRVLWDNLPIWFRTRELSEQLAARGAALVASTYTNAWGELAPLMDASRPLRSMANVYLHPILNRGTGHKLDVIRHMIRDYRADGVILHSDRSCKPYSIGQLDQAARVVSEMGRPALVLEADHNDERNFADEQANTRLEAFLEMLEARG